jgi:hypothetical protein
VRVGQVRDQSAPVGLSLLSLLALQEGIRRAHAANIFVPQGQFAWSAGEDLVNHFKLPGAKTFAVSFCTRCGTRVPHNIRERNEYLIPAGVLDDDPVTRPQNSIF